MKVLAPLFAFFALAIGSASAQNFNQFNITISSPTQGQKFTMGDQVTVQTNTDVCFVSLFVAYTLNDSN